MTSHAAVVARGMGKCCVAGCSAALIDEERKTLTFGQTVLKEGDWITLNGSTGEVIVGQVPMVEAQVSGDLGTLLSWADEIRALGIRTNADTPTTPRLLWTSAPKVSVCAELSTCSLKATASVLYAT